MALQTEDQVLDIASSESGQPSILVFVSTHGSQPLDLRLLGTDGEDTFALTFRQSQVSKAPFRDAKNQFEPDAWRTVLRQVFLNEPKEISSSSGTPEEGLVQVNASNATVNELSLVIKRTVGGVVQRLGHFTLLKDDELEIDIIKWLKITIARSSRLEEQMQTWKSKFHAQSNLARKLDTQLEEMTEAKLEGEKVLLQKCTMLINTKKAKLRELRYQLTQLGLDPAQKAALESGDKPKPVTVSNRDSKGKRKMVDQVNDSDSRHVKDESSGPESDHDTSNEDTETGDDREDDVQSSDGTQGSSAAGDENDELPTAMPICEAVPATEDAGHLNIAVKARSRSQKSELKTVTTKDTEETEETDDDEL